MIKSCIRCSNYIRCKDPQKSIAYSCGRYSETTASLRQEKAFLEDILEVPFRTSTVSTASAPLVPVDEHMYDVSAVLEEMLNDKRIVSPDIKIPEGDFAEAPNFHTWCVSDEFLNQKPFVMQSLIGTKLFAEYCPACSDTDWMENEVRAKDTLDTFVRKVALLEHGVCPHCGKTRLHFFRTGQLAPYWELSLCAGQRSGKSALFGMMASYLTHRMIKLERPNEVLGLLKANVLQGTFVALTFRQALDTLWEPYYGHLLEAPWYQKYHEMLNHVHNQYGGDELYKLKDTFVYYRHRRIQVYPAGPDKRVLRGRTRFVGGIDELGWFQNGAEAAKNIKMNANEVYIALERSLLTVRSKATSVIRGGLYNVPFGYFINISSPSSARDKIMELVRKSQGSNRLMGLQLPTWKMNPHVPRRALSEEFRKDPEAAMRDYGAQPPLTNSPFISSHERVEACLSKKKHLVRLSYQTVRSKDKSTTEIYAQLDTLRIVGKPSVLALDAGYSNNSFAFALGHLADNGYPIISNVGEVIPSPGSRINHSLMYSHLLSSIAAECNIVLVCADRWNSLKVLADFEQDFETTKRQYSLKYVDMQLFKSYIDDGQILLPKPTKPVAEVLKYDYSQYPSCFKNLPADHLVLQLLTVQDTGSSVLKGDQLTDDLLRATMLCHRMLIDEENAELLSGPGEEEAPHIFDFSSTIISKHYSGGGFGGNTGVSAGSGSSLGVLKSRT